VAKEPIKTGRPRAKITLEEVEKLGALHVSQTEAAAWFGVSRQTFENRLTDPEFREAWEHGKSDFAMTIRAKQRALAAGGNATMLIWLGKQILGQKDRLEHTGKDDGPIVVSLEQMSDEQLRRIASGGNEPPATDSRDPGASESNLS
jgi:predicted DNA-binding protein (UPF0251 family)